MPGLHAMKLEVETDDARMERLSQWRPYFCWLPRQIAYGDVRWLETVERRAVFRFSFIAGGYESRWEYRPKCPIAGAGKAGLP
jgi:hypothetical protein